MAKFFVHDCEKCGKKTHQVLIGYNEDGLQVLSCGDDTSDPKGRSCGQENLKKPAEVTKKKTTWPYYHEGTGMRFESESHEQKYAKHHKLEKV